jgi:hypothetical protein
MSRRRTELLFIFNVSVNGLAVDGTVGPLELGDTTWSLSMG